MTTRCILETIDDATDPSGHNARITSGIIVANYVLVNIYYILLGARQINDLISYHIPRECKSASTSSWADNFPMVDAVKRSSINLTKSFGDIKLISRCDGHKDLLESIVVAAISEAENELAVVEIILA